MPNKQARKRTKKGRRTWLSSLARIWWLSQGRPVGPIEWKEAGRGGGLLGCGLALWSSLAPSQVSLPNAAQALLEAIPPKREAGFFFSLGDHNDVSERDAIGTDNVRLKFNSTARNRRRRRHIRMNKQIAVPQKVVVAFRLFLKHD